ncbi:PREDICTED: calcium-transporting ATPase [Prunus dulcis]|uniref:Calcium-transporting ATPase n=1 Tax=Prunus dulcis TaxID=3755 RepID=A0A5E4FT91_PRUDU|nr:putative calcium-transporting ATPase 13, plasma membrane-type [Prunus dulcis]VVA30664.1 PREDICTED: calcium-transporting ATPase [Prunus dulcis]
MADTRSSGHHLDLESQQTVLLITGTNPPRVDHWRWIFVILQVRKLLISSRANRANKASPQLSSSNIHYTVISTVAAGDTPDLERTGTTEISPASPQVSGDVHLSRDNTASDAELQHANVAKIVKDEDFVSLQKFGGTRGIAEALNTDLQNGIPGDQEDICRRRMVNALSTTQAPAPGFFKLLLQSCNNYTIVLLFVAGLLSIGFGIKVEGLRTGWYEGAIIMFAILIHVIAPSIRDFWLENSHNYNAVIQTAGMSKNVVEAFRGGCPCELSVSDVVPGDLVCLKRGSVVPADGLFVSGEFLVLDDGMETTIDDKKPFMFYGAKVVSGNGRMLVTSVGMDTALGELMNRIAHTPNRAQLPAQLDKMNTRTQIAGLSISILLLVVLFFRFLLEKKDYSSGLPELKGKPAASKEIMNEMGKILMKPSGQISILTTALAILLVGVVEGIPLFVTLAITYWNRKTLSGKAIAQGILACVTMGSVTTICTDKTGVLTLNSLEVDVCYIGNEVIENDCVTRIDTRVREALCNGICTPLLKPSSSCSSSEDPLLPWAANLGMEIEILRQSHTILEAKELRTNEEGSGVLMKKSSDNEGDMCLHWKGPATTILAMCSHYTDSRGTTKVMDAQRRLAFNHIVEHMQSKHLKTIAFAYKQTDVAKLEENSLILIGLLGVNYTCCEDIMEAVKACQEAGVNIILVSEEKVSKLKDIAVACGILANSNRLVLEGEKFRNSSAEERMDMVDKICVMGNSIPSDRLLLVQCLKEKDHAVAMVGVRTNETPTLKEADVGVAMGTWSSEMARESSDIIIWDGNFSFLVPIISCGRCIYYNIQKYIQLELTMNISGLLITATTTMASGESAITAIQLFWANMVVTLLGGLALLMEPPTKELMEKPPVRRTDWLISKAMWRNIVSQALYQSAILVSFQLKGQTVPGISKKVSESIVFNSFVLCHVFNQVNSRELEKKNVFRGILHNQWFWVSVGGTLVLQVAFIEISHILVGNARLNWAQWGVCLLIGMVSWEIDLVVKCVSGVVVNGTFSSHVGCINNSMTPSAVSGSASNLELPLIVGNSTRSHDPMIPS